MVKCTIDIAEYKTYLEEYDEIIKMVDLLLTGQDMSGERGIRTPETLLTFTRFPGVRLQPLGHLSRVVATSLANRVF